MIGSLLLTDGACGFAIHRTSRSARYAGTVRYYGTIRESKIGSGDYSARSKLSQCDACAGTKKHTVKTQSKWVQKRCSVYSQRRFESSLSGACHGAARKVAQRKLIWSCSFTLTVPAITDTV